MRHLFIGGPGRSGTSFVADRLGNHPSVVALKDIELKIFCEKNGLLDLFHTFVETYSPNRAVLGLDQFRRMVEALIEGRYGQPPLTSVAPAEEWRSAFGAFTARLLEDGHPSAQTAEGYLAAARALLARIAGLAAGACDVAAPDEQTLFLEKTPHNLLNIGFLARLAPGAAFLHVMRDPRAIAWSLLAMPWGPDELAGAARWVDSYCRAWSVAESQAAGLGLPLHRLHIEDAVAAPEEAADWLAGRLALAPRPGLLSGADAGVLNRGVARAGPEERALLQERLAGWAAHFGYERENLGCRTTPAFSRPVHTAEIAATPVRSPSAAPVPDGREAATPASARPAANGVERTPAGGNTDLAGPRE